MADRVAETEVKIMRDCLVALSQEYHPDGIFYRRNVGMSRGADGRVVRFGLAGQADIAGIVRGLAVEIEVKAARGTQSEAQRNWQHAVERAGGFYALVHSVEECLRKVRERLSA